MRKIEVLFLLALISTLQISCQNIKAKTIYENNSIESPSKLKELKKYILKQKSLNSDFNYSKLDNIDKQNKVESFEPIDGNFTYYKFIATFIGQSYLAPGDSGEYCKTFHDILIIKTNDKNVIVDAYQYTLEWAEMPFQYDVFKSNTENLVLVNDLDIKLLNLNRTEYCNEKDKKSNEIGIIKLN
ncbi:hypothetical protein [Flavobacterium stagni]|uniref:Uncharacterized protein n=1 Tax=Flavobacterium stagni TaxID=2506421 RepID=A0A4Q1K394_9FLAO|nr:hypothetical protein [Flavobacterium stagni]RXR20256.1 hypothetical protein EQG61_12610 [Flavobacterium stagni]